MFFCGLAVGPLKLMANDGALRGRICCVCLKTALRAWIAGTSDILGSVTSLTLINSVTFSCYNLTSPESSPSITAHYRPSGASLI